MAHYQEFHKEESMGNKYLIRPVFFQTPANNLLKINAYNINSNRNNNANICKACNISNQTEMEASILSFNTQKFYKKTVQLTEWIPIPTTCS